MLSFPFFFDKKKTEKVEYSNFFVFQNYELRFSGFFKRILIRSFPGTYVKKVILGGVPCGY